MPAREYWSGQIRLALVSIPVQLFSASKSAAKVSFNQIHKPSGKRIRYEKVVPGVGAIDTEEIVRGYEVEKGKYVLSEDQEIDDVKLEAKRTIDLVQFVNEDEIDRSTSTSRSTLRLTTTKLPARHMLCFGTRFEKLARSGSVKWWCAAKRASFA